MRHTHTQACSTSLELFVNSSLTLVMMSGSPCSSPPFRVNPHGAPPFSCTWMCWKDTSCSTVSIMTSMLSAPPCNHNATSSRQPETSGMRGQAVGWPVMGFPWTISGGSAWDCRVDVSDRSNGQLGERVTLTDQWNYSRGGNFIERCIVRCATVWENSGKLLLITFGSWLSKYNNSDHLRGNWTGQEPWNGLSSKASANWNVAQSWNVYTTAQKTMKWPSNVMK